MAVFGLIALLALSVMMSTKQDRADARERFKPVARVAWLVTAGLLAFLFVPWGRLF